MSRILIVKDYQVEIIEFIIIKNPELKIIYCNESYSKNLIILCQEGIEYPNGTPLAKYNCNPDDPMFLSQIGAIYGHKFNLSFEIYGL